MEMWHRILSVSLLVTTGAVALSAQARPNFSGTWVLESSTPNGVLSFFASQIVEHDGEALEVGQGGRSHHNTTYTIDGREHEEASGSVKAVSKATWQGQTLVLERTATLPTGGSRPTTQVWSLDPAGTLIIKLTTQVGDSKEPVTFTNVYRKK